jgi:hypothetical protein
LHNPVGIIPDVPQYFIVNIVQGIMGRKIMIHFFSDDTVTSRLRGDSLQVENRNRGIYILIGYITPNDGIKKKSPV